MLKFELIKKEIKEYLRTPKGMILAVLFLFTALTSPILGRYMNEIIAAVAPEIVFDFPDPTLKDAWLQFYKNTSSMSMIVYLIIMTGTISQEKNKGSILLVLTKKVSRFEFVFSKFLVGSLVYTVLLLVSTLVSAWYTNVLFGAFMYDGLFVSILLFWLMGLFFTALAIFVSVIGKTPTTSALLGFLVYAILQVLNISIGLAVFNPAGASAIVNEIMIESFDLAELWKPITSALVMMVLFFVGAQYIFKKQEI